MGERKVLNKYYPPDFDPAKLPRGKRAPSNEMKVRMMLPMSIRCNTCGNFMYKGTKFNTRKEDVQGETYLGMQIFRFYFHCRNCAAEFAIKTDLKNSDYVVEAGASRNYEPWRESDEVKAENKKLREEEEMGNAMKALENRTLDSKKEMDILSALDELKGLNSRHSKVSTQQVLHALLNHGDKQAEEEDLPEEDMAALQSFFQQRAATVKSIESDDDDAPVVRPHSDLLATKPETTKPMKAAAPKVTVKPKRKPAGLPAIPDGKRAKTNDVQEQVLPNSSEPAAVSESVGGIAGLGEYGSDGSE